MHIYYLQKKYNRIRALLKFKRFIERRQASTTLNVPRLATNFGRFSLRPRLAKRISNILIPAPQNFLLLRPPPSPPLPIHPNPPHHLSHPPLTIPSSHGESDGVRNHRPHDMKLRFAIATILLQITVATSMGTKKSNQRNNQKAWVKRKCGGVSQWSAWETKTKKKHDNRKGTNLVLSSRM